MYKILFHIENYSNFLGIVDDQYFINQQKSVTPSIYKNIRYKKVKVDKKIIFPCNFDQKEVTIKELSNIEKHFWRMHNRITALYRKHNIPNHALWWEQDSENFAPIYKIIKQIENFYEK